MAGQEGAKHLTRRAFMRLGLSVGTGLALWSWAPRALGGEPKQLVGDVLDFALKSNDWPGDFGYVTFRLQRGFYDGMPVHFIRTDCSDRSFAAKQGLLLVPRLKQALQARGEKGKRAVGDLYLFSEDVVGSQGYRPLPVLSSVPGKPDYSPFQQVHIITRARFPELLVSVSAIEASLRAGEVEIETTEIVVNYPVVRWPGGELPHDTRLERYLGEGQLIRPVDLLHQTVAFKLQKCFPNFHYIVTDTSMAMGAQMMHIAYSPGTALLQKSRKALARVFVFGNGIPGGGPMGFQSSVMDPRVGSNFWSPLWDHFTVLWKDPGQAVLLTDAAELQRRSDREELLLFNGTPATHPQGFAVNCPIPVIEE